MIKSNKFRQGIFKPIHESKYKGTYPIIYRSSYELRFMRWCDSNPNIIKWGSESNIIPYYDSTQRKVRRYFVDNFIELQKDGKTHKYLIEIKPSSQTVAPVNKKYKRKTTMLYEQTMFINNQEKWAAAKDWCKKNGYQFAIITEKDLPNV